jgi:hypothetical protein
MSFATATIQGYVTWIGKQTQTPSGRNVINLLVAVPDKKKDTSSTYKLSVWDAQSANVLQYIKVKQKITAQGALSIEHYPSSNVVMRLDFASILEYGYIPDEEKSQAGKSSFVNMDIDNLKKVTEDARRKQLLKSK